MMLTLLTIMAGAGAVQVVEHAKMASPPPPAESYWSEPWSVAALIFVSILLLLVFARCIFSVCEITCDREDTEGVATQSAVTTGLSRA